jgi:hypothetical protein
MYSRSRLNSSLAFSAFWRWWISGVLTDSYRLSIFEQLLDLGDPLLGDRDGALGLVDDVVTGRLAGRRPPRRA